jgi:DNA polymerase V
MILNSWQLRLFAADASCRVWQRKPLQPIRDKVAAHGVWVFSSNDTLYGDISRRVVAVYEDYTPNVEIYSIDECFLDFSGFRDREGQARTMRSDVCAGLAA